jgi:deoxyribodipyrimidine photolyase
MPPADLEECGVVLSINYPSPIIDHSDARTRALAAYAQLKELMAF